MIEIEKLPEDIREKVKKDIQKYGEWATSHFLYMAPFSRMLHELHEDDTDFVWFIVTIHLINLFGSKDPSPVHFSIARERLKLLEIENDKAVDILARALVVECQNLKTYIFKKFCIEDMEVKSNGKVLTKLSDDKGWLIPEKSACPDFKCSAEESNALDIAFVNFLEISSGKCGQEISKTIKESASSRYKNYKESAYSAAHRREAWSVWIPQDSNTLFCPFLSVLCDVVWSDKCKQRWDKERKYVPALTQGVLVRTIKPPLSKDTRIEVEGTKITCYSENGKVISTVPCVDPKLVNLICKGMEAFSSLSGHRLLRWQVRTGFNNWVHGTEDPRLICTSGGYEGIAHLIGSGNSNKAITEVKAMLHAQAYGHFEFPHGGSGNMIILRETAKHKNGEPSKINIILGEFLLPNFTHFLPQGEKRRLVPITDLPPLIGSKNTHAAQAMLQLLILEEFSKQSDRLAANGSVLIPSEKFEDLASQAKLPKSSLQKVIIGWTEDDFFSKAFLKKYGDEYTLGKEYASVIDFLEYQGKQRIDGSKGGVKSVASKKELIKKQYLPKKKTKS